MGHVLPPPDEKFTRGCAERARKPSTNDNQNGSFRIQNDLTCRSEWHYGIHNIMPMNDFFKMACR
jgi:hypothetical protein